MFDCSCGTKLVPIPSDISKELKMRYRSMFCAHFTSPKDTSGPFYNCLQNSKMEKEAQELESSCIMDVHNEDNNKKREESACNVYDEFIKLCNTNGFEIQGWPIKQCGIYHIFLFQILLIVQVLDLLLIKYFSWYQRKYQRRIMH